MFTGLIEEIGASVAANQKLSPVLITGDHLLRSRFHLCRTAHQSRISLGQIIQMLFCRRFHGFLLHISIESHRLSSGSCFQVYHFSFFFSSIIFLKKRNGLPILPEEAAVSLNAENESAVSAAPSPSLYKTSRSHHSTSHADHCRRGPYRRAEGAPARRSR